MDTRKAQEALGFQHHSWPDMLTEMRRWVGWKRYLAQLFAPVAKVYFDSQSAYRGADGSYADPWGAMRARLGETRYDFHEQ